MSFKIGSCKVTVSFLFFVVLCICSLSDKSGLFLYGICAAILHELGHLTAALCLKMPPRELSVNSAGMIMHIPNLKQSAKRGTLIALSGPSVNLIAFFLLLFFSKGFAYANLALCLLNLLPCDPFDGGHIFRLMLEKVLSSTVSDAVIFICTLVVLSILVCIGTFLLMRTRYNISLLTLSMLIFTTICQRTLK